MHCTKGGASPWSSPGSYATAMCAGRTLCVDRQPPAGPVPRQIPPTCVYKYIRAYAHAHAIMRAHRGPAASRPLGSCSTRFGNEYWQFPEWVRLVGECSKEGGKPWNYSAALHGAATIACKASSATGVKKWVASRWVYFILLRWSASSAICCLSKKYMHAPSLRSSKIWADFDAVDDIATAAMWYFPQLILTVGSVPLIGSCTTPSRWIHFSSGQFRQVTHTIYGCGGGVQLLFSSV